MHTLIVWVTTCAFIGRLIEYKYSHSISPFTAAVLPMSSIPYLVVLPCSMLAGALLGVLIAGSRLSRPFPFGPALAVGAMVAIFMQ